MSRVWVDDVRPPPDDTWTWAKTYKEAIDLIGKGDVEYLCLDHDLGEEDPFNDGTKIVQWMISRGIWPKFKPHVHSMNPVGKQRMEYLIAKYGGYQ